MYSKKGVVYKLYAGWFINRTPGEFMNWGLFIKFEGLLCANPTERGESLILNFWPPGSLKSNPGTVIVCCRRGASEQEKIQYNICTVNKNAINTKDGTKKTKKDPKNDPKRWVRKIWSFGKGVFSEKSIF